MGKNGSGTLVRFIASTKNLNQAEIEALKQKLTVAPDRAIKKQQAAELQQKIIAANAGDISAIIELAQQYCQKEQNSELKEFAEHAARLLAENKPLMKQHRVTLDKLNDQYLFSTLVGAIKNNKAAEKSLALIQQYTEYGTISPNELAEALKNTNSSKVAEELKNHPQLISELLERQPDALNEFIRVQSSQLREEFDNIILSIDRSLQSEALSQSDSSSIGSSEFTDEEIHENLAQTKLRPSSNVESPSSPTVKDTDTPIKQKRIIKLDDDEMKRLQQEMKSLVQKVVTANRIGRIC